MGATAEDRQGRGGIEFAGDFGETTGTRGMSGPLRVGEPDPSGAVEQEIGLLGAVAPIGELPGAVARGRDSRRFSLIRSPDTVQDRAMKRLVFLAAFSLGLPALADVAKVFTNVYVVPPTFLKPRAEQGPSARGVLVKAGIDFPEGTSAVYNAATSQLIVRTTEDRMALVESYIESIAPKVEKQTYVTVRELEFEKPPQFLGDFLDPENLPEADPRKSSRVFDSREKFLEALSRPPADIPAGDGRRRGLVGVFTDPQFQVVIRASKEELNLKEIPMASVMARSGQHAILQDAGKRWGIVPVIGGDEFTIDLEYYLPAPGEAFFPDGPESREPEKITIWDGQTVAWAEEKKDGGWRIVFITATLIDPAGRPVNPEGHGAPEKQDP